VLPGIPGFAIPGPAGGTQVGEGVERKWGGQMPQGTMAPERGWPLTLSAFPWRSAQKKQEPRGGPEQCVHRGLPTSTAPQVHGS
jgi:hypothetical protein